MELIKWFANNWPEVAASLGFGAGSGVLANKLVDKNQDKRIEKLELKIIDMDKHISKIESDLATNILFDKQFREQMEKEYHTIKEDMREVKGRLEQIFQHLLNSK